MQGMVADSGSTAPRTGRTDAALVLSVGHSSRSLAGFLGLLTAHGVQAVADIRRHPVSRRHPHFAGAALARALGEAGIDYVHIPELGGMREPHADSPHAALADGPFRGYADHMASEEFARGLARLLALAGAKRSAAMCAEADPAHCHRSLLADALLARGHAVAHIVDAGPAPAHGLHVDARTEGENVVYDGLQRSLPLWVRP
jgi:uncharacterized protein (DUF488 family)